MPVTLLGLDPGFASIGWAVVEESGSRPVIKAMGVIRTEKSDKKQKVLASDDNFRRARELAREIRALVSTYRVDVLCAESMSFPRNSSTAAKMAMAWGVIADICEQGGQPMLMATPKGIKKAVCHGDGSASKEDVQTAMKITFGDAPARFMNEAKIPQGQWEHPFDALAAVVACRDSETIRLLKKVDARQQKDAPNTGTVGYDPGSSIG